MMRREAAWLGEVLADHDRCDLDPMLSVGSGSRSFRMTSQPWIERKVYEPLARRGIRVLHHELMPADGVDVVGDLGDAQVRDTLRELGVRTILCLNVFEHVVDREGLASALLAALPPGGVLIVTVPRRFPYHEDPIDTLFRPSPHELSELFSGATVVDSGTVRCESLLSHWLSKPGKVGAIRKVFRRRPAAAESAPGARAGRPPRGSIAELARMGFVSTEQTYVIVERGEVG